MGIMGKNCNPAWQDMRRAWYASPREQVGGSATTHLFRPYNKPQALGHLRLNHARCQHNTQSLTATHAHGHMLPLF